MSISLPNGLLMGATTPLAPVQLSASVTRILALSNFPPELKTRDLQGMFKEWENDKGGFRIKWVDDVNALVVFADAGVAKRAYLTLLHHPPTSFTGLIKPYDSPDAAQIIASLNARAMGHRGSSSVFTQQSQSQSQLQPNLPSDPTISHQRSFSSSNGNSNSNGIPIPNRGQGGGGRNSILGTSAGSLGGGGGRLHGRSGSASSSWGRQSLGGLGGGGVLNFPSSRPTASAAAAATKLPTHSEGSADPSRSGSSSSNEDPTIVLDPGMSAPRGNVMQSSTPGGGNGDGRRGSISADKALREVQKALANVDGS